MGCDTWWRRALALARGARRAAFALVVIALGSLPSRRASAQALSDWPVDPREPEAHVPTAAQRDADPLQFAYWLMDVSALADAAVKRNDHAAAVELYRALARAVPDRSVSYAKLCASYEALGDRAHALESCAAALGRDGVKVEDYAHYVHLVLAATPTLGASTVEELDAIVEHLQRDPKSAVAGAELACEIGVHLRDAARLERCTEALERRAPDAPATISFRWALAIQRGDGDEARRLLVRARSSAMSADALARMERATAEASPLHTSWPWRALRDARLAGVFVVLAVAGALFTARRGARPRAAPSRAPPHG